MVRGKNINLFLMDGRSNQRVKASLSNWHGLAFKLPRTLIDICKDRSELNQSGIYFLFGIDDETGQDLVYIGQACVRKNRKGVLYRLQEHKRSIEKDYWTHAVVITTSNNSLGPTEISYLEHRFYQIAQNFGRVIVKNQNSPSLGHITEEKESELEEFIENSRLLIGTLGYQAFEELTQPNDLSTEETFKNLFYLSERNSSGIGKRTEDGFVVLKGSLLRSSITKSCPSIALKLREKFKNEIDLNWCLKKDILFTSPSSAACFLTGASVNGMIAWKDKNGKTLKELDI